MSLSILALSIVAVSCAICLPRMKTRESQRALILLNKVTHARISPTYHAFVYPTITFLLPLCALESSALNLGLYGSVFGYGRLMGRLTALRSEPYLTHHQGASISRLSITQKLRGVIGDQGELDDAWIMTMPSILGYEGINPLTVYFCYNKQDQFYTVVLEIHNTFGESHIHILRVGQNQEHPDKGYNYQWTFHREFHVSPFNDRSGFYTISVKAPVHPPSLNGVLPAVRVQLRAADERGQPGNLKLTAVLRANHASPFTTPALFSHLIRYPLTLFLSMPRILYHAWILHYRKRLDVYVRPPPKFSAHDEGIIESWQSSSGQGVKWDPQSWVETWCRRRTEEFLAKRVKELHDLDSIELISGDPSTPTLVFPGEVSGRKKLRIRYLAPKFFVILFIAPNAELALLLGCRSERVFFVSDETLFRDVFSTRPCARPSATQEYRMNVIPKSLHPQTPTTHPLDASESWSLLILRHLRWTDAAERVLYSLARVRFKSGEEPWDREMWYKASLSKDCS